MHRPSPLVAFVFGLIVGAALVACPLIVFTAIVKSTEDNALHRFQRLRPEMTREEVTAIMGSPGTRHDQFRLPEEVGHEMDYYLARRIGAAYFVYWEAFPDVALVAAFDIRDRLVFKASGGT
jgi:hypothetical protein